MITKKFYKHFLYTFVFASPVFLKAMEPVYDEKDAGMSKPDTLTPENCMIANSNSLSDPTRSFVTAVDQSTRIFDTIKQKKKVDTNYFEQLNQLVQLPLVLRVNKNRLDSRYYELLNHLSQQLTYIVNPLNKLCIAPETRKSIKTLKKNFAPLEVLLCTSQPHWMLNSMVNECRRLARNNSPSVNQKSLPQRALSNFEGFTVPAVCMPLDRLWAKTRAQEHLTLDTSILSSEELKIILTAGQTWINLQKNEKKAEKKWIYSITLPLVRNVAKFYAQHPTQQHNETVPSLLEPKQSKKIKGLAYQIAKKFVSEQLVQLQNLGQAPQKYDIQVQMHRHPESVSVYE